MVQIILEIIPVIHFAEFWKIVQNHNTAAVGKNPTVDHVVAKKLDEVVFKRLLSDVGVKADHDVVSFVIQIIVINSFLNLRSRYARIIQKIHQKIICNGAVFQKIRVLLFQQMFNAVAENLIELVNVAAWVLTGVQQNAVYRQFVTDVDGSGKISMHTEIIWFSHSASGVVHLSKNLIFFKIFYSFQIQVSVGDGCLENMVIQSRVHAGISQQF